MQCFTLGSTTLGSWCTNDEVDFIFMLMSVLYVELFYLPHNKKCVCVCVVKCYAIHLAIGYDVKGIFTLCGMYQIILCIGL